MLTTFHGDAVNRFTAIPGFGTERMIPLYKEIPFEVPFFSTGDVETEKDMEAPTLLKNVFAKSSADFHDSSTPVVTAQKKNDMAFIFGGKNPGFGGTLRNTVVHGLQLRLLDLVGLIDPDQPKVYSGGKAIEVMRFSPQEIEAAAKKHPNAGRLSLLESLRTETAQKNPLPTAKMETRDLDLFEVTGVAELSHGKELFVRQRDSVIRMLGALRAIESCVQCHTERKVGDLLGAFSYTFVDTNKVK